MLNRDDIVRIIEAEILSKLTIQITDGDFTSPNDRIVVLEYNNRVIDRVTFSVKASGEYEG